MVSKHEDVEIQVLTCVGNFRNLVTIEAVPKGELAQWCEPCKAKSNAYQLRPARALTNYKVSMRPNNSDKTCSIEEHDLRQ